MFIVIYHRKDNYMYFIVESVYRVSGHAQRRVSTYPLWDLSCVAYLGMT